MWPYLKLVLPPVFLEADEDEMESDVQAMDNNHEVRHQPAADAAATADAASAVAAEFNEQLLAPRNVGRRRSSESAVSTHWTVA